MKHVFVQIVTLIAMTVSIQAGAQQKNQPIAKCLGSILESGAVSESYKLSKTEDNKILIEGQYKNTRDILVDLQTEKSKVEINDDYVMIRVEKKILRVLKINSLEVDIDFSTGRGLISRYVAYESLLKAHKIYLENCERIAGN